MSASVPERWLASGSGLIDWCEHNYVVHPHVAEFWNTVSNVSFIIVSAYGFHLYRSRRLPVQYLFMVLAVFATGLFSAYFHASLSFAGQKLDESAENAFIIGVYHHRRPLLLVLAHSVAAAAGFFTITYLFCELHLIGVVLLTLRKLRGLTAQAEGSAAAAAAVSERPRRLRRAAVLIAVGAVCWVVDRVGCQWVGQWPQLHAWWHVFAAASIFEVLVLVAGLMVFERARRHTKCH